VTHTVLIPFDCSQYLNMVFDGDLNKFLVLELHLKDLGPDVVR
jgi:hypothetical protein